MDNQPSPPAPLAERVEVRHVGVNRREIVCPCLEVITLQDIENGYHRPCARTITLTVERTIP